MKKILFVISFCIIFFSLSACTSVKVDDAKRTPISIEKPSPLRLEKIEWTTVKVENQYFVALDVDNFGSFERNNALIQGRLDLYNTILDQNKIYYNN